MECRCFSWSQRHIYGHLHRIDLQWRYKISLPFVASFPLLAVYAATGGSTWIGVPSPVSDLIGRTSINLGTLRGCYRFCPRGLSIERISSISSHPECVPLGWPWLFCFGKQAGHVPGFITRTSESKATLRCTSRLAYLAAKESHSNNNYCTYWRAHTYPSQIRVSYSKNVYAPCVCFLLRIFVPSIHGMSC